MNLLRIGAERWSVLITEQVLTELSDWGSAKEPKVAMVSLLTKSVPLYGPQEDNPTICKALKGAVGIAEFRKGERRGPKVRVLWFYGDSARTVLVCARAFVKTFEKTPPEEISAAQFVRSSYLEDLKRRAVTVEEASHLVRRKK